LSPALVMKICGCMVVAGWYSENVRDYGSEARGSSGSCTDGMRVTRRRHGRRSTSQPPRRRPSLPADDRRLRNRPRPKVWSRDRRFGLETSQDLSFGL